MVGDSLESVLVTFGARSQFGLSGVTITLTTPASVTYNSGGILSAVAGYSVSSDSFVYRAANALGTYSQFERWAGVGATPANYDVRATLNSGTSPAGSAVGSWLQLNADRTWSLTSSPGNTQTCNLTVEIRPTGGGATLANASVTLTANAV
jgi:hypothetical protein